MDIIGIIVVSSIIGLGLEAVREWRRVIRINNILDRQVKLSRLGLKETAEIIGLGILKWK